MNMSFYVGAIGAGSCLDKLSVIGNNLANVNTNGYKPKTTVFSDLLNYNLKDGRDEVTELQAGAGVRTERTYTSFGTTALTQTGGAYDYMIMDSNAFFMVQNPETGALSYTRCGHFHQAEIDGGFYLATDSGKLVLDRNGQPIRLDGEDADEDRPDIGVYTFNHPSRLLSTEGLEYVPRDAGEEPILVENPTLISGALEASGTDMALELSRVIECQRAYSYALRMVTTSDEVETTINNLR